MNSAVGINCPKWMCPEALGFVAWHPEDEDLSEEIDKGPSIVTENGLELVTDLCKEYAYSYNLFHREKARGLVFPEKRNGRCYMRREDFEKLICRLRVRGRPCIKKEKC
jgi:hypothetical protein